MNRRTFIRNAAISTLAVSPLKEVVGDINAIPGQEVEILNPMGRVPVSFIIDDSTALVNMAYYGIPQFGEVFPEKYLQDWRSLPREIPDAFVLEFIGWCNDHGVKGKYSMVPYPACTGWLHRFIPGWTKQELQDSLRLVRDEVTPNWDIHPEMISHTRVIDITTGQPYPQATPAYMENWDWSQDKSADELASYMAYALNVLKEAGYYCDGITTPGGFGSRNMENLARGTMEAVREVYQAPVSHFFRDLITEKGQSVAPVVMAQRDIGGNAATCSVHIIGCTGDWFGGWDGLTPGHPDRFITADLSSGRMVDVVESGEPAIMVCHWPGIYYNGEKHGFNVFKQVVERLEQKYGDDIRWMKLTDIASYWAAREFIQVQETKEGLVLDTPFGAKDFTIRIGNRMRKSMLRIGDKRIPLKDLGKSQKLEANSFSRETGETLLCFDLPKGRSELVNG